MPLAPKADYITSTCEMQPTKSVRGNRQRPLCAILFLLILISLASQSFAQTALPDAPSTVATQEHQDQSSNANGQARPPSAYSPEQLIKRGLRDQFEIYTAPFHRSALKWDVGMVVVTGAFIAADRHLSGQISSGNLNISRDISNVGFYGTLGAAGASFVTGLATHDPHAEEAGFLSGEAVGNAAVVFVLMKAISSRERPLEGDGKGYFFQYNRISSSFPSGHAILTWSAASVLAHEYPKPWVKWLAYGTAAAVSVTRVTAREHFPADVVVGSTFGYLIGRHIFHAHCKPGLSEACPVNTTTP
jgi:hypothetical protein